MEANGATHTRAPAMAATPGDGTRRRAMRQVRRADTADRVTTVSCAASTVWPNTAKNRVVSPVSAVPP